MRSGGSGTGGIGGLVVLVALVVLVVFIREWHDTTYVGDICRSRSIFLHVDVGRSRLPKAPIVGRVASISCFTEFLLLTGELL